MYTIIRHRITTLQKLISHARNIIKYANFDLSRLFLSFSDEALPKCGNKLLQFMWFILRNIRRRIAKILPCIYRYVFKL